VLSIDTAHVPGVRNSYFVIQVWRATDDAFYLIDQWRERVSFGQLEKQVKAMKKRLRPSYILVEAAGAGIALAGNLEKRGGGTCVEPIIPGPKGKLARFADVLPIIKARKVYLPRRAAWTPAYNEELTRFPNAPHDDQVDATTQFLSWQSENPLAELLPSRDTGVVVSLAGRILPSRSGYDGFGTQRRYHVFSPRR